ncbi:MAG: PEGA domain-containing protein [Pseudomonadota bacterium]
MTPRNALILILCFLLGFPPSLGAKEQTRPRLAVVDMDLPEDLFGQRVSFRNAFAEAFSKENRVQSIPEREMAGWRERRTAARINGGSKEKLAEARELLNRGKKAYNSLEMNRALSLLEEARRQFILNLNALRSNRDLIDVHLYLGVAYAALKKEDKAKEEFRRVVYLDPQRQLASRDFAPKMMALFSSVRQEVLSQEPVRLRIESNPSAASVFINGKRSGSTPLELRLLPTEYFILVEKEGVFPWYQPVNLSRRVQSIEVRLKPASEDLELMHSLRVREGVDQQADDVSVVRGLAESVGAQIVLLAQVKREGGYRLLGQLYDVRTSDFSRVVVSEMGNDTSDFQGSAQDVAKELMKLIRPDGYVSPGSGADLMGSLKDLTVGGAERPRQETMAAPPPPKQWYENWWIWPLIAGAGVGIYFGVRELQNSNQSGTIIINNHGNF